MLRLLNPRRVGVLIHQRSLSAVASSVSPSSTTTVLLRHLPNTITQKTLSEQCGDPKNVRKIELEPGFTCHLLTEADAIYLYNIGNSQELRTNIVNTSMPALVINNIPSSISIEKIVSAFKIYCPIRAVIHGSKGAECTASSAEDALKLRKLITSLSIDSAMLKVDIVTLKPNVFIVKVHNIPEKTEDSTLLSLLETATKDMRVSFRLSAPSSLSATVRLNSFKANTENIREKLGALSYKGIKSIVSPPINLHIPSLFIRGLEGVSEESLMSLLSDKQGVDRIEWNNAGKDRKRDLAVVYFASEQAAMRTLADIKGVTLDGMKLSVSLRHTVEPAVKISNLPAEVKHVDIAKLFASIEPVSIISVPGTSNELIVTLKEMKDIQLACSAYHHKVIREKHIDVTPFDKMDIGLEVSFPGSDLTAGGLEELLLNSIRSDGAVKNISAGTNKSAMIGFENIQNAVRAQNSFHAGKISITPTEVDSLVLPSRVSILPSFTCEVIDYPVDQSVASFDENLNASGLLSYRKYERKAMLKYKRHMYVAPGITALKKLSVDGTPLRPEKYAPLVGETPSTYDTHGSMEEFDQFSLKAVLKDYMHADPATRYLIAKNRFERAIHDAKAFGDISLILRSSVSEKIRKEAEVLLNDPTNNTGRLFELFLQKEDMDAFTKDFRDLEVLYGPMDEKDPFNWSQFRMDSDEEVAKLEKAMIELEGRTGRRSKKKEIVAEVSPIVAEDSVAAEPDSAMFSDEDETFENLGVIKTPKGMRMKDMESGEEKFLPMEDHRQLKDKDGHLWSGIILNSDTTQKITPGVRILSFRTLVVVGNGRGTAGFGKGKGLTADLSLASAFRDALRNLSHIDLYDNYGLAQDLYGKHNSCHAYVRATPVGRQMVGSEFASSILTCFGISSASVKFEGRRHPYAMVRALFNAIEKHVNLDDIAKARGKRYLTIRWAHDNGLV